MKFLDFKNNIIFIVIILIAGICIGVIIRDFPYLTFNTELSIGNISQALLTLFVATYIPFFLSKQINDKRAEKDMVMSDCVTQDNEIQQLRELIEQAYSSRSISKDLANRLISKTRHISKKLHLLEQTISTYFSNKDINKTVKLLNQNQISCWEDLTIHLRDKKPKIESDTYMKVTDTIYTYSGNLTNLKICVNRFS